MNNLSKLNAWSDNGDFSAPQSAHSYMAASGSLCGAGGDKNEQSRSAACGSACGTGGDKKEQPKPSACGAGRAGDKK